MTIKTKIYVKKYQSDNLAKRIRTNNQQMCIDCLKPRSNKNKRECKKNGCDTFMCQIIRVFQFQFLEFFLYLLP